jgi:hypothetical protein
MTPVDIRAHLNLLLLERVETESQRLAACPHYIRDLEDEIAEYHSASVCIAVLEIARLRAELSGPQMG